MAWIRAPCIFDGKDNIRIAADGLRAKIITAAICNSGRSLPDVHFGIRPTTNLAMAKS
jgi:hypothetical protein